MLGCRSRSAVAAAARALVLPSLAICCYSSRSAAAAAGAARRPLFLPAWAGRFWAPCSRAVGAPKDPLVHEQEGQRRSCSQTGGSPSREHTFARRIYSVISCFPGPSAVFENIGIREGASMANTMARSFLQAVATEEVTPPLRVVQMEGLAVLKIIKHCKEFSPALVTGQLLGLDVGSVLEVTNCFPFPIREDEEEVEADGANYQLEMMRCLREANVDNNTVGWYQSTLLGSYQTVELIETFMNYQENIRRCVCIIYDPSRSNQGFLALKALRLTDSFMDLHRNHNFSGEKLREKKLSWVDIFEEIPIKVSNSALASAFMTELEPDTPVTQCDYDRLKLSTAPFMERNLEFLIECMEDLSADQNKFQYYYRNLSRQQAQQQSWLQKRRAENLSRKAAGEEPLPEEDPSNPIFKPIPEPSRLDGYLIANQISNYCNQINSVAGQSFERLYLMKALHEK